MRNKLKRYTGAEVAQPKSIAEQLLAGTRIGNLLYGKQETYKDGNNQERKNASFKESANGQLVQRMGETAKDAGNLALTGLAFGNPLTASNAMAPLITGAQAYWIGHGINDGAQKIDNIGEGVKNFVEDPSWQNAGAIVKEVPMLALDVVGALPVARTVIETGKNAIPAAQRIAGSVDDAITTATKQAVESGVVGVNELPAQLATRATSNPKVQEPLLNVGWAPSQTMNIRRAGELTEMYYPNRWDVVEEGANPFGVWLQGKFGTPRTNVTNPGKGEKAARARELFANRPQYVGKVAFKKPIQTIGEVPDRSLLSYKAEKMGADGIIYNDVYDNGYNNNQVIFSFNKPKLGKGWDLYERPSKLTLAERMGIPKGDRANLTQDQLEGLEDLMHYNTNGKYRWRLTYNDATGFARTTAANRPEGSVPGVKALLDAGAEPKTVIRYATKTGNWNVWPTRPNTPATFSGGDFPVPEGMGWAPGDLSLMLDGSSGKGLKVIMTSPRVDLINSMDDAPQTLIESLPNTIDKNIMRRFWQNNDQVILPGSYLSGDNGTLPLGLNGISAIDQGKSMSGAISEILHPTRFRPHGSGLSPDSMISILKQGQRPGHAVRYGPGFTQLNNSAVYNKHIYDAWTKYKSGTMTANEFKTIFDDWFVPQGGRPLEIRTPNKFRWIRNNDGTKTLVQQEQTPYIVFPHPYVHYKKKGGKLPLYLNA